MNKLKAIVCASLLTMTIPVASSGFAQSDSANRGEPSASSSMHRAGESTKNAAENTYHGVKRAAKDTAVTARVKLALHDDKTTSGADIHVDTIGGVVTLSGTAPTETAAQRAVNLAEHTKGVASVKNAITVSSQKSSMR